MDSTDIPRHRAPVPVRTEPRVQPVPRHAGEYAHEDRTLERLGALLFADRNSFAIKDLMAELADNPFRRSLR